MKRVNCLCCGSGEHEHLATYEKDPYLIKLGKEDDYSITYVVCKGCGFVFTNPMLEAHELDTLYSEKLRPVPPNKEYLKWNYAYSKKRYEWIKKQIGEFRGKALDVGCAAGATMKVLKEDGWEVYGIEPADVFADFGRKHLNLDIKTGFYGKDSFPEEKFNLIVISQVLEHILDPVGILNAAKENLADDGFLFIGVPTIFRPIKPMHPNTLQAIHLYMFSLNTLRLFLSKHGFDVTAHISDQKGLMVIATKAINSQQSTVGSQRGDDYQRILEDFRIMNDNDKESLYNRNIAALNRNNPEATKTAVIDWDTSHIKLVRDRWSEIDSLNLMIGQSTTGDKQSVEKSLYTKEPIEAARKAIENIDFKEEVIVVLFGFAMGYLPVEILKKLGSGHVLMVIERDEALFKSVLKHINFKDFFEDKRVHIVLGEDKNALNVLLSRHSNKYLLAGRLFALKHHPSYALHPEWYNDIAEHIKDRLKVVQINRNTMMGLGFHMMNNILENMPLICDMPGVNKLKGLFKGVPAIIVSAGPSLEKNVELLKQVKGKAIIIACDTVIRLLLPNGIMPDLIVTADPLEATYRKFRDLPMDKDSNLICHPNNYPDIISTFAGKRFLIGGRTNIYNWLSRYWGEKGSIDMASQCVAHMAFNLARVMGSEPIIFLGQDLCYYDRKRQAANLVKGAPWEHKELKGVVGRKDILGNDVETSLLFESFKVLFDDVVPKLKIRCINATEGGLGVKGTEIMTLKDVIDDVIPSEPVDIAGKINSVYKEGENLDINGLVAELQKAHAEAKEIIRAGEKIIKYAKKVERLVKVGKDETDHFNRLSQEAEKIGKKIRGKEQFLGIFSEYAYGLELVMSSQKIIEIDDIDDPAERFKKQMKRADTYYSGIIKFLKPFEKGVKSLMDRIKKRNELEAMQPVDLKSKIDIAKGYKEISYFHRAISILEEVIKEFPENIEALYHLGDLYLKIHHPMEALEYFRKASKISPKYMNTNKLIRQCNEKSERWNEKVKDSRLEEKETNETERLFYEADFYLKANSNKRAASKLQKLINIDPTNLDAYLKLVVLYEEDGDYESCISVFEKAMGNITDSADLYKEIGLFSMRTGFYDRAYEFFMTAASMDNALYEEFGDIFYDANMPDKAADFYHAGYQAKPENAGLMAKAVGCYQKIVGAQE